MHVHTCVTLLTPTETGVCTHTFPPTPHLSGIKDAKGKVLAVDPMDSLVGLQFCQHHFWGNKEKGGQSREVTQGEQEEINGAEMT